MVGESFSGQRGSRAARTRIRLPPAADTGSTTENKTDIDAYHDECKGLRLGSGSSPSQSGAAHGNRFWLKAEMLAQQTASVRFAARGRAVWDGCATS